MPTDKRSQGRTGKRELPLWEEDRRHKVKCFAMYEAMRQYTLAKLVSWSAE